MSLKKATPGYLFFFLGFECLSYQLEWIRFVGHYIWCIRCFSHCHLFHFNGLQSLIITVIIKKLENVFLFLTPHIVSHFAYQHPTIAPPLTNLCRLTCIEARHEVLYVDGELLVLMTLGWRSFLDQPVK